MLTNQLYDTVSIIPMVKSSIANMFGFLADSCCNSSADEDIGIPTFHQPKLLESLMLFPLDSDSLALLIIGDGPS